MVDWNKQYENRLIELSADPAKYSLSQIAAILSSDFDEDFTKDSVRHRLDRFEASTLSSLPAPFPMPYYEKYAKTIEEGLAPPKNWGDTDKRRLKILSLSDLHIPFCREDLLQLAIDRNRSADICVLSEVSDFYSLSSFKKRRSIPLEVEIEGMLRLFEYLSCTFPRVVIIGSNHQDRVSTNVLKFLDPSLLFLFDTNMTERLARPFPNIKVTPSWYIQINDAIFCHADKASVTDGKPVVDLLEHFRNWSGRYHLNPFKVIVQAHTHYIDVIYRDEIKLIQQGCLCQDLEYTLTDHAQKKPHLLGYAVVEQLSGVSDLNLSREYYLPYAS